MNWLSTNPLILVYTSAIMDIYWTLTHTMVGCALVTAVYFGFGSIGYGIGQTLLRVRDPFLSFAMPDAPSLLVLALGWFISFCVLAVFVGLYLLAARQLVRLLVSAAYSLGRMGTVWVLNTLGGVCLIVVLLVAFAQAGAGGQVLERLSGTGTLIGVCVLLLSLWLHLRYHPTLFNNERIFDMEIGAALYQLLELRTLNFRAGF